MHDQEFSCRKIMDEVEEKGTSSAESIITLIPLTKGKREAAHIVTIHFFFQACPFNHYVSLIHQ